MLLPVVIGFGLIGLIVLVGGVLLSRRESGSLIEERLGPTGGFGESEEEAPQASKSPIGDALNRALTDRGIGANLATQLARADLKITVGEFMAATVILIIAAGGIAYFVKRDILVTIGACAAAFFAPRIYLGRLRGNRLKAFNEQLGDAINLMVNGIRAGYSVLQAMESVSQEMAPPISEEFGRIVREMQFGIPMDEAMDHMLRRAPSDDLDMLITAINVQREVGGNLAEVLESISFTIRERVRIKGEIQAKTAMTRGSGYMIAAVPIIVSVIVYLINPAFMGPMFVDLCGQIMLGVALLGIVVGFVVINKVVQIDV
jgi:tight adherence protein B